MCHMAQVVTYCVFTLLSSLTLPLTECLVNVTQHTEVKLMHLAASLHFTNYCTKLNLSDVAFKCAYFLNKSLSSSPLLLSTTRNYE